ncbi:hypothetical protein [Pedobacter duraquae]|uniref:Uncharacterized protein n=1 Tax=Pedobacter duraquae TaxID=425511 RepID=A0A4R6IBE1_9SPHI|nr:hypothetical protein [Pedobacter duraquae]TDO19523.1 hypothetical protein CLV32_4144 [Pedobacter duraquae]
MKENPINVSIKGFAISDISNFRYGQQLHDQRFFELKFRRPLIGDPFSLGTGDPESYAHQPVTLQFPGAFGKMRSVSGTILKLEFISTAAQAAEVVVSGTMYQPGGYISKFSLALMALLICPIIFAGFLFFYVSHFNHSLSKTEGTVSYFNESGTKGTHNYTFKISPYQTFFNRSYHTPVFSTARQNIDALFNAADGTFDENLTGQKVTFYIVNTDQNRLNNRDGKIDFLYMKSAVTPHVKFDYYYDLLIYITDKTWFYFVWITELIMEIFFFSCALYCYKMYALDQQQKNRILWFTSLFIAALLNIGVLAMML